MKTTKVMQQYFSESEASLSQQDVLQLCRQLLAAPETGKSRTQLSSYFLLAAQENWRGVVELLIDHVNINQAHNKSVNPIDQGWTALTIAASKGHVDIVRILLSKGASINQPKHNGATALFLASHTGHLNIVLLLLKYGAKVNLRDDDGATAAMSVFLARPANTADILFELQRAGADLHIPAFVPRINGSRHAIRVLSNNNKKDKKMEAKMDQLLQSFPARVPHASSEQKHAREATADCLLPPPPYEANPHFVMHVQAANPNVASGEPQTTKAAQIRQLEEQIAALQQQQGVPKIVVASPLPASPSPVVTPLRDLGVGANPNASAQNENAPSAAAPPQQARRRRKRSRW